MGRPRRARVRATHRLRTVVVRVRQGDAAERPMSVAPDIGVGMLGYAFMGKAHSNAYLTLPYMTWPPPLRPVLVSIAGRNADAVAEAAQRYGFTSHVTDWRDLVDDD